LVVDFPVTSAAAAEAATATATSLFSGNVFIVDKRSICQVKLALRFLLGSSIIKKMFITSSVDPKSEDCCRIANAKMMFGKEAITSVCEDAVQVLPVLSMRDEMARGFCR
jgi:hypothetical protein